MKTKAEREGRHNTTTERKTHRGTNVQKTHEATPMHADRARDQKASRSQYMKRATVGREGGRQAIQTASFNSHTHRHVQPKQGHRGASCKTDRQTDR
mmetsp:Transcript_38677/g.76016  ORF Transcript_38677/g.76016 Transcript_38677/m.76016 type:complete len:97 (+) Transcript_38677:1411-1701(+)